MSKFMSRSRLLTFVGLILVSLLASTVSEAGGVQPGDLILRSEQAFYRVDRETADLELLVEVPSEFRFVGLELDPDGNFLTLAGLGGGLGPQDSGLSGLLRIDPITGAAESLVGSANAFELEVGEPGTVLISYAGALGAPNFIRRLDLESGDSSILSLQDPFLFAGGVAYAGDGELLLLTRDSDTVALVGLHLESGAERLITTFDQGVSLWEIAVAPGGHVFGLLRVEGVWTMVRVDLSTGEQEPVPGGEDLPFSGDLLVDISGDLLIAGGGSGDEPGSILRLDPQTGELETFLSGISGSLALSPPAPPAQVEIPTLDSFALGVLAILLALLAVRRLRRTDAGLASIENR